MNHDEIRETLHAYADGELDLLGAREIEKHLHSCDECRRAEEQIRALRDAITTGAPAYRVPARLRRKIRAALQREVKATERNLSPWFAFAIGAAMAALVLAVVVFQTLRTSHGDSMVEEVIGNHVRSLLATHLVDVASSDQHTVKPWFDGKVDFAPDVRDFSTNGFPLAGGRLDYLGGKTVVALVYQRNKHPINVFIMPATRASDSSPALSTQRGYNIFHWTHRGMEYWTISDLNETELRQFAALIAAE
jgi:anti-sigma factor RsiW